MNSSSNSKNQTCSQCSKERKSFGIFSCKHVFCAKCIKKFYAEELKKGNYFEMNCLIKECSGNSSFFNIVELLSETNIQSYKKINCESCQQNLIPLSLGCGHVNCFKCTTKKVKKSIKSSEMPCCIHKECKYCLKEKDLCLLGLGKKYLDIYKNIEKNKEKNQNNYVNNQMPIQEKYQNRIHNQEKSLCTICYCDTKKEDFRKLFCGHEFCIKCLKAAIESKINSNQSQIICPEQGCGQEINYYIVKDFVSKENFEKYDNLLLKSCNLENNEAKEKKIACPKCNLSFFIWEKASYFSCSTCKITYCSNEKCLGDWALHKGKSCADFCKCNIIENEKLFQELAKKEKFVQCPKCKYMIEKIKGFNYIRCESSICQKKTLFCYLCGKMLEDLHVKGDFLDQNGFGLCECQQNVPKNEEMLMNNKNGEKTQKNIEKKKNIDEKCWFCGENTLHLEENFNEKIAVCKSNNCKNKIVCLICRKAIKEKDVLEHMEIQCISYGDDDLYCNFCNCERRNYFKIDILAFQCKKCNSTFCLKCKMPLEKDDFEVHFPNCYHYKAKNFFSRFFKN